MPALSEGDIVVVIPGILGSSLERRRPDGSFDQTWGYGSFLSGLGWPRPRMSTLVERLTDDLALDDRAFDDSVQGFGDGTRETGPMRTQGIIPGFWTVQGYDRLLVQVQGRLDASDDEVFPFAYDWRQSNRVSAHRLKERVVPLIKDRRREHPNAQIQFVCHSMGGIVARYFAECLDHERLTRRVITIGTPYQGAVKALAALANGFGELAGRDVEIGPLVRSWPSVAELLPTYPCLGQVEDDLSQLTADSAVGHMPEKNLRHGVAFRTELHDAIKADPKPDLYRAMLGYTHPTAYWASVDDQGLVVTHEKPDPLQQGDGTVHRAAAWPPEWGEGSRATAPSGERHGGLQQAAEIVRSVAGLASTDTTQVLMSAEAELAANVPPLVEPGDRLDIEVFAHNGDDRLALQVDLFNDGDEQDPRASSEPPPQQ